MYLAKAGKCSRKCLVARIIDENGCTPFNHYFLINNAELPGACKEAGVAIFKKKVAISRYYELLSQLLFLADRKVYLAYEEAINHYYLRVLMRALV